MEKNIQNIGAITEQKCFLKCLEHNFTVSKPLFDNARYDFILDTGTKLLRIQIKTSRWVDEEHSSFIFNGYSQHSTGDGNKRMKYTNQEIDFFMTERDGIFYLYPASATGFAEKRLRVLPTTNSNVTWASEYLFEEVIKKF